MTSELRGSSGGIREQVRRWLPTFLFVTWILGTALLWTAYALAPVGVLATADVGNLVSIQGSKVTTTSGFFHVSADPSAMLGVPLHVIRTNSLQSDTGLQLCTARKAGTAYWCNDISDGYAGKLSDTALAGRAWSHGTMAAVLFIALTLTGIGWLPAAGTAIRAASGDASSTPAN